jgi:outer membrane protein OmpA-like peptidoglycan-associated protein
MLLTDSKGKARSPRVQATVKAGVAVALLSLGLAGCSDVPNQANPVSWWHGLEGGEIARYRPPPPNPTAPFPRIADQPKRPVGMPDWEWTQLSAALAGQRTAAQAYAAQNPIPTLPSAPAKSPVTAPRPAAATPVPTPQPPGPQDASQSAATAAEIARLAAAPGPAGSDTPPPSAAAVATATANATATGSAANTDTSALTFQGPSPHAASAGPQSVPIGGAPDEPGAGNPGGPATGTKIHYFDPTNGLSIPGALDPAEQPDEAHPPPVPASVPVPPAVPGFAIPTVPATYVAPKALPEPAPYAPPAPLPAVAPVPIQFAPDSAVLTPPMQKALLNLIRAGHGAHIAVTGFGDAPTDAISDQAAAMPLALERTRAMVVQLMAYGAAPQGISAEARALGAGGLARLVE